MRRLGDRFVVEEALGAGGMGSIHRGRDERLGQHVAIKLLKRSLLDDPILTQRFRREALTLSSLCHPGIVRVLDFGESDGDLYMVLELLRGETLETVIAREGAMPPPRALPIVDRILAALETCHANAVVHRDVKPANVMVDGDDVKLIDFGLAKVGGAAFDKLTETGTVHGTPHYMAPEQCRGEDVGPASDIYSVGVLSYEMLAGKPPFAGADAATFMAQHLFFDPPALTNVSPGIAAVVSSALAKRPEDRPSARALREAFTAARAGADPITRGAVAANHRVEHLATPRDERALGSTNGAPARDVHGTAVVWMAGDERSASLLGCLGTASIACTLSTGEEVPDAIGAVIVVADVDRLRRVRERDRKSPVVVVDVRGPEQTTEVIRLGADDMLLRDAPDADLVAKVKRLLRRKART